MRSMDSMGNWVDAMDNGMVGKGRDSMNSVGGHRNNGSMANRNHMVGTKRGLNLDETLGVVRLAHGGVGRTKGLGLNQASLLTVGSCHCLVGGLSTNSMVGKSMVSKSMVGKSMVGKAMVGKAMMGKPMMTTKKGRLSRSS